MVNTLRWTKGRHEIATGIDYSYGKGDIINNFRANGRYTFNNAAPFTGDALADFLLGEFQSFEQGVGEYKNTRFHYLAAFAEDTWRVNPRVTLTMGLRWDPNMPYTDANGRLAGYRPGQESQVYTNAPVGMLYPGDAGFPDGGYDSSWGLFAPRVGGAWDVTGDGKTSLRAGYGLFYDKPNSITTNSAATVGPFGTVARVDGNATTGFDNTWGTATNPFPVDIFNVPSDAPVVLPFNAFSYAADMRPGKMHSWHVTGEREIFKATMLRVAYAGSRGDGLTIGIERNPATYAAGRDHRHDQPAPAAVPRLRQHHQHRAARQVHLPLDAGDGRSTPEQRPVGARQLHAQQEHGQHVGEQAERLDGSQPVRPVLRLGSGQRRPPSPLRGLGALGAPG